MNEKTAILNVRMLGDFSITYDGRQVSFGKKHDDKSDETAPDSYLLWRAGHCT